jgi:hypothetical protein
MLPPHNFVPKTSFSFSVDDMVSILGGQSYRLPPLAADAGLLWRLAGCRFAVEISGFHLCGRVVKSFCLCRFGHNPSYCLLLSSVLLSVVFVSCSVIWVAFRGGGD